MREKELKRIFVGRLVSGVSSISDLGSQTGRNILHTSQMILLLIVATFSMFSITYNVNGIIFNTCSIPSSGEIVRVGDPFMFRGINLIRYFTHYELDDSTPHDPPHEEWYFDVLSDTFAVKMVRISVTSQFVEPEPGSGNLDHYFIGILDEELQWCIERDIKVILDCHIWGPDGYQWPPDTPEMWTTDLSVWLNWWDKLLEHYESKDWLGNPVWGADLINEPHHGTPEQKRNAYEIMLDTLHPKYPEVTFILEGLGGTFEFPITTYPDWSWISDWIERYHHKILLDSHVYYDNAVIDGWEPYGTPTWAGLYQEGRYSEAKTQFYQDLDTSWNLQTGDTVTHDLGWAPFKGGAYLPYLCGEFGCGSGVPRLEPHKLHWLRDFLDYCESKSIPYLFWRYGAEVNYHEWACVEDDWQTPNAEGQVLQEYFRNAS